jgi:hypothetical protein
MLMIFMRLYRASSTTVHEAAQGAVNWKGCGFSVVWLRYTPCKLSPYEPRQSLHVFLGVGGGLAVGGCQDVDSRNMIHISALGLLPACQSNVAKMLRIDWKMSVVFIVGT